MAFATVQTVYHFFVAATHRWNVLKSHIGDKLVLKTLSDTRWEAHANATKAIFTSFGNIIASLQSIANDETKE